MSASSRAADDPLAPQVLRTLSDDQAPLPGALTAGDPPLVWVAADDWPDGPWWRAGAEGHLLAPRDAARTPDGVAVLVEHCPHRLAEVLARRGSLEAGEAVTIAVSLLRGCEQAYRLCEGDRPGGQWWLTAQGRPVLALNGTGDWRAEAQSVFDDLATSVTDLPTPAPLAAALRAGAEAIADERALLATCPGLEAELFAAAAAVPLRIELVPVRARAIAPAAQRRGDEAGARGPAPLGPLTTWVPDVAVTALSAVADWRRARRARRVERQTQRGARSSKKASVTPSRRRTPLLVAGAVAVCVLVVGLTWPQDDTSTAVSRTPSAAMSLDAEPESARGAEHEGQSQAVTQEGPVATTAALLAAWAACADAECRAELTEDASGTVPAGIATEPHAEQTLSLLEDYGGVAAVRVDARDDSAPSQIVVIVRDGAEWRVRDVYDVEPPQ